MAERRKVLIAEDESLFAMALEIFIEEAGFASAGLCATGEEAIERALSERPALVLMDLRLAGAMSGLEAARIIDAELGVPVVIISGYAERVILERSPDFKPRAILSKPIDYAELEKILRSLTQA
jgi:DNA-binding NarL/FixJ family response regulator